MKHFSITFAAVLLVWWAASIECWGVAFPLAVFAAMNSEWFRKRFMK